MKQVILTQNYVSQDKKIKALFLDTSRNLYLKKGSTGIGGTTTILEDTSATRIVVSPTVGMIQGKEKQKSINNSNCFFIYGGSEHRWSDFFNCQGHKVVNCTPEQILNLYGNNIRDFNKLTNYTIFVDEIHQYICDSSYRESMLKFIELVFNEWKANWILSTATDNTISGRLIDIPPGKLFQAYEIVKPNQEYKNIEVFASGSDIKINKFLEVINASLSNGRKLLIATNRSEVHKKLSKLSGFNVINLVGSNIEVKLRTHKSLDEIEKIQWHLADVIVISSKYFAGFDIPLDVDVLIDTNPKVSTTLIGPNDIRQIIGRARTNVGRIVLFIGLSQPPEESKLKYEPLINGDNYKLILNNFTKEIKKITTNNWAELSSMLISDYAYWCLIFRPLLKLEMQRYGFGVINYTNSDIENILTIEKYPFHLQLQKLVSNDLQQLEFDFMRITKYLKYKIDGIFKPDLAILFYCAIKIKQDAGIKININYDKSLKAIRLYTKLNKHFKGDTKWDLLYGWLKSKLALGSQKSIPDHAKFSKDQLDYLEIRSLPNPALVIENPAPYVCYKACVSYLDSLNIKPNAYESSKLLSRCKEACSTKDFNGFKSKEQLLKLVGWCHLYVLNGGREFFDFPIKRNRQYNPLTQLPGPLRSMMNIKLVEIDIKHANPTFIDRILGSNIAKTVYENIMNVYGVDRSDAKIQYNMYLNNDENDAYKSYKFFRKIGYTEEQASQLSDLVTSQKGAVYDRMTEIERDLIERYGELFLGGDYSWFRFHDAIIIEEDTYLNLHYFLPASIDDVDLDFKYYNDDTKIQPMSLF